MPDRMIECQDCGQEFVFTERDQEFFAEKGFVDPKRCKPCRDKKKARRDGGGGRGGRDRR